MLYGVDLRGLSFGAANLSVQVFGSIADGVDFSQTVSADGEGGGQFWFGGSSIVGADLRGAWVALGDTDATDVDFSNAFRLEAGHSVLVDALLDGVVLTGSFDGTDLTGASTSGTSTTEVTGWADATCPDGSSSQSNLGECPFG